MQIRPLSFITRFRILFAVSILTLTAVTPLAHAGSHTVTLTPPSGQDGFDGDFTFSSGFRNCYGNVSVGFGNPSLAARRYHYRGRTYTPSDLGLGSFKAKRPGGEISADVYHQELLLGRVTFENVTFFSAAGCFSEIYKVIQMLSRKDSDYLDKVGQLSLRNLSMRSQVTDSKIEQLIERKLEKESSGSEGNTSNSKKMEPSATTAVTTAAPANGAPSSGPLTSTSQKAPQGSVKKSVHESPSGSNSSSGSSAGPSFAEAEKNRMAQETIQNHRSQVASDQTRVAAYGGAAQGVMGAASAAGFDIGMGLVATSSEPLDAVSSNNLFSLNIGSTRAPYLSKDSKAWTSGGAFCLSVNLDFLLQDPTPKTYSLGNENSKRWMGLVEYKVFGNLPTQEGIQPYLGIGIGQYREYSPKLNYLGSRVTPIGSLGFAIMGPRGWFALGWNPVLSAYDIHFAFEAN